MVSEGHSVTMLIKIVKEVGIRARTVAELRR